MYLIILYNNLIKKNKYLVKQMLKHMFTYNETIQFTPQLRKILQIEKKTFDNYTKQPPKIQPSVQYVIISNNFFQEWRKFISASQNPIIVKYSTPSNLNIDIINTTDSTFQPILYSETEISQVKIFPKQVGEIFEKYPGYVIYRKSYKNKRQIQLHPKRLKSFMTSVDAIQKLKNVQTVRIWTKKLFLFSYQSNHEIATKILRLHDQSQQNFNLFKFWIFDLKGKKINDYGKQMKLASKAKRPILQCPGQQITKNTWVYDKVQNDSIVIVQKKTTSWLYFTKTQIQSASFPNLTHQFNQITIMKTQKSQQIAEKSSQKHEINEMNQQCVCGKDNYDKIICQCFSHTSFCSQECLKIFIEHQISCKYKSGSSKLKQTETLSLYEQQQKSFSHLQSLPIRGLINLGNTCYMNSALQSLISTSLMTNFFIQKYYLKEINKKSKLGYKGQMANAYGNMLLQMSKTQNFTSYQPIFFKQLFSTYKTNFKGYDQHDSQQFLLQLLDALHEDLNRVTSEYSQRKHYQYKKQLDEYQNARQFWKMYMKYNQSIITDLFVSQLKFRLSCLYCNYSCIKFQNEKILSIPIPEPQTRKFDVYFFYKNYWKAPLQIYMDCPNNKLMQLYQQMQSATKISKKNIKLWMLGFEGKTKEITDQYTITQLLNMKHLNFRAQERQLFGIQYDQLSLQQQNNIDLIFKFVNYKKKAITFKRPFLISINQMLNGKLIYDIITRYILKILIFHPKNDIPESKLQQQFVKTRKQVSQGKNFKIYMKYKIKTVENQNISYVYNQQLTDKSQILEKIFDYLNQIEFQVVFSSTIQSFHFEKFSYCQIHKKSHEIAKKKIDFGNFELSQCIGQFSKQLNFSDSDGWICPKCKSTSAENKMEIYKAPRNLILHLKRFKLRDNRYHKNQAKISLPFQIDLKSYLGNQTLPEAYFYKKQQNIFIKPSYWNYFTQQNTTRSCIYELYATINHSGSLNGGHYIAYAKINGKWMQFNDRYVNQVTQRDVSNGKAYILFYQRKIF